MLAWKAYKYGVLCSRKERKVFVVWGGRGGGGARGPPGAATLGSSSLQASGLSKFGVLNAGCAFRGQGALRA